MGVSYRSVGSGRARHGGGEITDYTLERDATPWSPDAQGGAVGTFSLTAREDPDGLSMFMGQNVVTLTDTARGEAVGLAEAPSGGGGSLSLSGESWLKKLVIEKKMPPQYGRLEDVFKFYLRECGVLGDRIKVDRSFADRYVCYKAWIGDVWTHMKMLCTAIHAEIGEEAGVIVLRPLGTKRIEILDIVDLNWSVSFDGLSRAVAGYGWNTEYTSNAVMFPRETDDNTILSVEADQISRVVRKLTGASPVLLNQPRCVERISTLPYQFGDGEYVIVGKDDLPVKPDWWNSNGGQVRVSILDNEDEVDEIEIALYGPVSDLYGPYRLAESAGGGADYSAIYITGAGVLFQQEPVSVATGATYADTSTDVTNIDNEFFEDTGQAYERCAEAASELGSAKITVSLEQHSFVGLVGVEFDSIAGALFTWRNSIYRVDTVTLTRGTVTMSASRYVDGYDFNEAWPYDSTGNSFNNVWTKEFNGFDFMIQPLREDKRI